MHPCRTRDAVGRRRSVAGAEEHLGVRDRSLPLRTLELEWQMRAQRRQIERFRQEPGVGDGKSVRAVNRVCEPPCRRRRARWPACSERGQLAGEGNDEDLEVWPVYLRPARLRAEHGVLSGGDDDPVRRVRLTHVRGRGDGAPTQSGEAFRSQSRERRVLWLLAGARATAGNDHDRKADYCHERCTRPDTRAATLSHDRRTRKRRAPRASRHASGAVRGSGA